MIRNDLRSKEKAEVIPANVLYEPNYDQAVPVPCYFTNEVHLAHRSHIGKFVDGSERIILYTVRQCCFCQIFFWKK